MTQGVPTVGSFLFDYLYNKGVRTVFGIPGDFALPTFRWLNESRLRLITLTHEPSVGFAADGYARAHGTLGVAVVTYCVGGLNMLNSVACAYAEKSPMLVISGGPSPADRVKDPLLHHKVRNFDSQLKIYQEVTCAQALLDDPETAAEEIIRVVEAIQAHCRPGYLEIPYDIVNMPVKLPLMKNRAPQESDPKSLQAALEEVVGRINGAKSPVIVADVELHRHGLTDLALELASKFNIPIAATLLSKSAISETHPHYIGVYSGSFSEPVVQEYVENSDCVLLLGAYITDVLLGMNSSDLDRSRCILANTERLQVGYHRYDEVVLAQFLQGLANAPIRKREHFTNPNPPQIVPPLTDAERGEGLTAESFFRILSLGVKDGTTLVCDTGDALLGAIGLRTSESKDFISDAYYLSMGFAMPAAIGVMAANPDHRTIAIIGDGAFQMTGIELSTAVKEKMNPIVFVLNNDGYGTQRHIIDGPFNNILMWNYTKMVDLLGGGKSAKVQTKGELEAVLKEALADKEGLYLIEVIIPRDDCSRPLKRLGEALGKARGGK
jgi:indolepyruvate decarboxylase